MSRIKLTVVGIMILSLTSLFGTEGTKICRADPQYDAEKLDFAKTNMHVNMKLAFPGGKSFVTTYATGISLGLESSLLQY